MSRSSAPRQCLDLHLKRELAQCGLPWEIRQGGKHFKLFVADRFVTVLSRTPHEGGDLKGGGVAKLKRVLRELRGNG